MNFTKKIPLFFKNPKRIILTVIGIIFLAIFTLTVTTYMEIKDEVASYTSSHPIAIYDKDQNIIDYLSIQKGESASFKEIPVSLQKAFVSVEDRRFYSHHGIDVKRLGKAVLVNMMKGRIAQGGSTISQQLAKNAFLSNERTYTRKFKELIITLDIERLYSKDQILEKYMNEIYFGSGTYGVKEAANDIFNKNISDINIAESAMLAGIPNRPTFYNPRTHLKNTIKRTHLILKLMLNQEYITKNQYDEAMNHKFILEKNIKNPNINSKTTTVITDKGRRKREVSKAPDFIDVVEAKMVNLVKPKIYAKGGFKVYTTLDSDMQKTAKSTFENYHRFKQDKKLQGAMVTLDAKTGEVRSLIGGHNYRTGDFNRGTEAKRQIGSTFKPFVYYTAIQNGYTMNQLIDASYHKYGDWTPRNYAGARYKNLTMIQALEKSVNTVAVKLLSDLGISAVLENFKKTGVELDFPNDLTIALGSVTATPLELATSYIPFANGGVAHKNIFITKIEDANGNTIYENPTLEDTQSLDPINTSLTTYMLESVVKNGSGKGAKVLSKHGFTIDQGGKTGTSNDFKSAWFAGFTPDYVTVVYTGYDDNTSMPHGSAGGSLAAPLWHDYYQNMINNNIYHPTKFEFINDNIKSREIVERNIDIRTGDVKRTSKEFKRKILFKKGQAPKSFTQKIWNGFKGWFK